MARRLTSLVEPLFDGAPPLRIRAWDDSEDGPANAPVLHITSRRALRRLLWQPDELGLAQAYVTGELDAPGDAAGLSEGLRAVWASVEGGAGVPHRSTRQQLRSAWQAALLGALGPRPRTPASQVTVTGRMHSLERDRSSIAHHYDLSNDFYGLILDPSMAYSCGYYADDGHSLAQAQTAKLDLICQKLQLRPGMRLIDVGCGWGSLVVHAAGAYGVRALGVTISEQQHAFATQRVAELGLADLVEVRMQDYRLLDEEPFDAAASIEMGEHVGQSNYQLYVDTLHSQLKPGARLLLQQMSRRADAAPGGGPFIESYIAPDMHMRPLGQTVQLLEGAGFEVRGVQAMRDHYVRTVADWLQTFESHYDAAVAMVGEEVARVWRLYLVGGGLAFAQGRMGVDQILAATGSLAGRPRPAETAVSPPPPAGSPS
ncbi:MAG: class I SAM-dependent methyltransferase [Nocardioidaceae bacterium]